MKTYLVYADAIKNSNKFWSAFVEGDKLTVQWGRVGYQAQTKVHSCSNHTQAIAKFNNLVAEKKSKGYRESKPQMDGDRSITDIRRAIQLLNVIRSCIASRTFHDRYIDSINEYLRIVPTPLGMEIDIYRIYQNVADVDHQLQLLNSLLGSTSLSAIAPSTVAVEEAESTKTVSLKAISKNFWRHL